MGMDAQYKRDGDDVKKEARKKKLKVGKENDILNTYLLVPLIGTVYTLSISE